MLKGPPAGVRAGRAGRRNSQWGAGLVTCLNQADIPRLEVYISPLQTHDFFKACSCAMQRRQPASELD